MQYSDDNSVLHLMPVMREIDTMLSKHGLALWEKRRVLIEILAEDAAGTEARTDK